MHQQPKSKQNKNQNKQRKNKNKTQKQNKQTNKKIKNIKIKLFIVYYLITVLILNEMIFETILNFHM